MASSSNKDKEMPYIGELEQQHHHSDSEGEDSEEEDLDVEDDETWEDWVEEEDNDNDQQQPTQSLFDVNTILDGPEQALQHDKEKYGVDVLDIVARLGLDFHSIIRLINYIRATHPAPEEIKNLSQNALFLQDDTFLTPVIPNDPLLQLDIEELAAAQEPSTSSSAYPASSTYALQQQIASLQQQLSASQSAVREQKVFLEKEFQKRFLNSSSSDTQENESGKVVEKGKKRDDDTHYFNSYSQNEIHEIMLKDTVRTDAYRDFILSNNTTSENNIFKDKIVLDVGCGTGILSMFCAKAGAKKVYGVDASDIAYKAMKNVKENNLDGVVKIVKGKLEDLPDEEVDKVDIIVSEWMGYFLLYEAMLDSVLYARDRFLKPGGLMVPSQCSILLAAISDPPFLSSSINFWDSVYGFKMSSMKADIGKEADILVFGKESIVSTTTSLKDVFMMKDRSVQDADFKTDFNLIVEKDGTDIHGFLGWFDTFFTKDGRDVPSLALQPSSSSTLEKGEIAFTTGPSGTPTHWRQTFFLLNEHITNVKMGTVIQGSFTCRKNRENSRELEVEIVFKVGDEKRERIQAWVIA